ncbi:hypothetical protein Z043_125914, partial [Scleropages formosus]
MDNTTFALNILQLEGVDLAPQCRSFVMNVYCDNASLFKLSCQDVSINNTYGLAYTVFISGSS